MAQHVQETTVVERRLRPIYDSLELGNNKKALQEVEKLLKKSPKFTCARALKALALLRLGREDESNSLLNAITEEKPTDDATLQVLTFCYKEMEQLEKICELYNHAAKQLPGNEEILAHLFMSYVRLDDYKSQQATALQLYKVKPKNPYYFWAVMSVVLQGVRGPESSDPNKRKLYLTLAQKMVDKLIADDKLDAEQEVQLYLNILEEQGKFKEALEFMEGPICQKLYPGAPVTMKMELFKKMSMWDRLNSLLKELLTEERDRWDYYQEYLKICFELHKINPTSDNGTVVLEECHEFLCQLIEAGKRVRGPYLARLKLYCGMEELNLNAVELLGEFSDLIIEYFRLFGDKPCCTKDIALFFNHINQKERSELSVKLLRDSGISSTILPQTREQMQKHICSLQLSRICGSHLGLGSEHLLALYTALKLHYEHGLGTFGKDLLPTDMGPSDAYALLAAHIMFEVSIKKDKSDYLIEALCLLHYVLQNSPSNFHAKLLCLKIYHYFGCGYGAHHMYDLLDIKHVQLDSMGYLHCQLITMTGLISKIKSVYDPTLKFFTTSYKERLDYIAMSYKFGSFSKLQEFMDFRDRLSNSLHYAMISAEELLMELVCLSGTIQQNLNTYKLMSINPKDDRINWNELSDNRDLSVVVNWDPIDLSDKNDMKNESFKQNIDTLRIRSLLLRLIASIIDLFHFSKKNNYQNDKLHNNITNDLNCVHKNEVMMMMMKNKTTTITASMAATTTTKTTTTTKGANKNAKITEQNDINNTTTKTKIPTTEMINLNNNKETNTLETLKELWLNIFKIIKDKNYKKFYNYQFLVNLLPSRINLLILDIPYEKFFYDLIEFILHLYTGNCTKSSQIIIKLNDNVKIIGQICCDCIDKSNKSDDNIWIRKDIQEKIYSCIEIFSLYAFVLSACHEKYLTSQDINQTRKPKKKENRNNIQNQLNENHCTNTITTTTTITTTVSDTVASATVTAMTTPTTTLASVSTTSIPPSLQPATIPTTIISNDRDRLQIIIDLMRNLKQELQNCNNAISIWAPPKFHSSLSDCMDGMSLNPIIETNLMTDVMNLFKENHVQVIQELRNIIKDKIRMINK